MTTAPASVVSRFHRQHWRAAGGALIVSAVLGALIVVFLPRMLPVTTTRPERATLTLVALAVVLILVWGSTMWWRNISVVVTPEVIELRRPFQVLHQWPREAAVFTSHVSEQRVNGIKAAATRSLVVHYPGGTSTVELPGFSRRTFNELMALLQPVAAPRTPVSAEAAADAGEPEIVRPVLFTVDAGSFARTVKGLAFASPVVGIVVGLVLALTELVPVQGAFVGGVGVALLLLAVALVLARVLGRIPQRIVVEAAGITVDALRFGWGELERVWLTPVSYPAHRLALVRRGGRRRAWTVGGARVVLAPDYAELVSRIVAAAPAGLVAFDRE